MSSVHSGRLERWLGGEQVERISAQMRGWYGPPIAVHGVPGAVYACGDGDFCGRLKGGFFSNYREHISSRIRRVLRNWGRGQLVTANAGFASLSDLIAEATQGGKQQMLPFQKVGTTGVANNSSSLWNVGNVPPAGDAGAAAPGGTANSKSTTGALQFRNAGGGDTLHYVGAQVAASIANMTLLLYDRLFSVAKTMNSTAAESVTGVPTRYQSTTPGDADSAEGNFLTFEVRTALAAVSHNWTTCTYLDQSGNSATLPSVAGVASAIINRLDLNAQWFAPLETGDTGIQALTQLQHDQAVTSGALQAVIGHPIAIFPCPIASAVMLHDGINSAFNLTRILDDACLALLDWSKPAASATTFQGVITAVSG